MGAAIDRRRKGASNGRARDYLKASGALTVVKSSDSALDLVAFYQERSVVVESTDASHRARARRRLQQAALPTWVGRLVLIWRDGQREPEQEWVGRVPPE